MAEPVRLSVVVPLYNTEQYLHDLLASFEQQAAGPYTVEYLFVDDSSPDRAGAVAEAWMRRHGVAGSVVRQKNAGVSAARNRGLDQATGDWVTFIDSDDYVSDGYFSAVASYIAEFSAAGADVALVSCNVVRFDESSGERNYRHPLRAKFDRGNRVYDLRDHSEFIQSQAASAFFDVAKLRAAGVRFLEGLHAAEDAIFVASYLLSRDIPQIACVPDAEYYYRTRASGDSAVDQFRSNRGYYFERFSDGYLPLFRDAAIRGEIPRWLATYFIYDMRWFFPRELVVADKATHLNAAEKQEVIDLISEVLTYLRPEWVREYAITPLAIEQRNLLLALMDAQLYTAGAARIMKTDPNRDLVAISYYFTGAVPQEQITVGTREARVRARKSRRLDYLGQSVLRERILWVEMEDGLRLELDGVVQTLHSAWYPAPQQMLDRKRVGFDQFVPPNEIQPDAETPRPLPRRAAGRLRREAIAIAPDLFRGSRALAAGKDIRQRRAVKATQVYAQLPHIGNRFRDAWVFIDRVGSADDNAEAVYWLTREQRPDINAWFVVRKASPHWRRMKEAGARLLDYGSLDHRAALMHAKFVISSNLDVEIVQPIANDFYWQGQAPWRFVYLQHGVLQHELSIWFNSKPIDLITTASVEEHASIVGDDTAYTLTSLETRLTGFPRHDALVRGAQEAETGHRRMLLFAPTWRNSMMGDKTGEGPERSMKVDFASSEFGRNWAGLLNDQRLHDLATRYGMDLAFLPHPNFRDKVPEGLIDARVDVMTSVADMAALMLSAKIVVTDYSSIFFDAAVAGADISYFQFDYQNFMTGGHTYVPGYWSYAKHGFGPVSFDIDQMVSTLGRQLDPDTTAEFDEYRQRVTSTLPNLDGEAASRVLDAILELG